MMRNVFEVVGLAVALAMLAWLWFYAVVRLVTSDRYWVAFTLWLSPVVLIVLAVLAILGALFPL